MLRQEPKEAPRPTAPKLTKKKFLARFEERPLSYSQKNQFEWNPDEWFTNYVLGIREPANELMMFGTLIGDSIGTEGSHVPDLVPPGVKEYEMRARLNGVPMIGFADHFCDQTIHLEENKTSINHDRWTQKKVDSAGQLTFYCLLLYLEHGIKPEDVRIRLNFIKGRKSGVTVKLAKLPVQSFETTRTLREVLEYAVEIQKTVDDMYAYYCTRN